MGCRIIWSVKLTDLKIVERLRPVSRDGAISVQVRTYVHTLLVLYESTYRFELRPPPCDTTLVSSHEPFM